MEIKDHLKNEHGTDAQNDYSKVILLSFPESKEYRKTAGKSNGLRNNEDSSIIKNNNPDWHCLNKKIKCKICPYKGDALVNHYVSAHPNIEVFPSRVDSEVARLLRSPSYVPKCETIQKRFRRWSYEQVCYFCNELKCYPKYAWINHMRYHTGYYKYQCDGCSKKFVKNAEHTYKDNCIVKTVSQPQFEGVNLIAYLCDICNFIRFKRSDIENHLKNEHKGAMDDFKEITFLTFPDLKIIEEKPDESNHEKIAEKADEDVNSVSLRPSPPPVTIEKEIAESSNETEETSLLINTGTDGTSEVPNELWTEIEHHWETF